MGSFIAPEVKFTAFGQSYTFIMDFNAACAVEEVFPAFSKSGMNGLPETGATLRVLFRAGLQTHHPDVDLMTAGRLIQEIGADRASAIFIEASKRAKGIDPAAPDSPPKAQTQTQAKASRGTGRKR